LVFIGVSNIVPTRLRSNYNWIKSWSAVLLYVRFLYCIPMSVAKLLSTLSNAINYLIHGRPSPFFKKRGKGVVTSLYMIWYHGKTILDQKLYISLACAIKVSCGAQNDNGACIPIVPLFFKSPAHIFVTWRYWIYLSSFVKILFENFYSGEVSVLRFRHAY